MHSLKRVCDDYKQVFPNSASPSNHAILNLIKNLKTNIMLDDLPRLRRLSVVMSEKREVIVKNVTECFTSTRITGATGRTSHTLTCHTLCSIAHPYKISIQRALKLADLLKRTEFCCQWLRHYTHSGVSVLIHSSSAKLMCKIIVFAAKESSNFSNNIVPSPKNWLLCVMSHNLVVGPIFWDHNNCGGILQYYSAILHFCMRMSLMQFFNKIRHDHTWWKTECPF